MARVFVRFYAELNDFLPRARRQKRFPHELSTKTSVKDMIESLGVPHTEVDLILAGDESVDFDYPVEDGDRISVYPVFETFDITPVGRLRPTPLRESRFVLDVHLGRLASLLRVLGFDTLYKNDYDDPELARISRTERRILLTRDIGLLKRGEVTHGYWVRATKPRAQVREVVARFDLGHQIVAYRRCPRCNAEVESVAVEEVAERLPPRVRERITEARRCPGCDKLYWRGTHTRRLEPFIHELLA